MTTFLTGTKQALAVFMLKVNSLPLLWTRRTCGSVAAASHSISMKTLAVPAAMYLSVITSLSSSYEASLTGTGSVGMTLFFMFSQVSSTSHTRLLSPHRLLAAGRHKFSWKDLFASPGWDSAVRKVWLAQAVRSILRSGPGMSRTQEPVSTASF